MIQNRSQRCSTSLAPDEPERQVDRWLNARRGLLGEPLGT